MHMHEATSFDWLHYDCIELLILEQGFPCTYFIGMTFFFTLLHV